MFVSAATAVLLCIPLTAEPQSRDAPIPHDTGQSVAPVFEGWYGNADGSFSLSFGYLNRNFQETVEIPVGQSNRFDPGPVDRGQPTHLLTRRQTGVFAVSVPADFGDGALTWSLTSAGETHSVLGHLRPEWEIDALHEITSGNRPPILKFSPTGEMAQGPSGIRTLLEVNVARPLALKVWASDDGIQKRQTEGEPRLGLTWSKYRGPGEVEFSQARPQVETDGTAATIVSFSTPGSYTLRVLAWDDSGPQGPIMAGGFQCCWTNAFVDVNVK